MSAGALETVMVAFSERFGHREEATMQSIAAWPRKAAQRVLGLVRQSRPSPSLISEDVVASGNDLSWRASSQAHGVAVTSLSAGSWERLVCGPCRAGPAGSAGDGHGDEREQETATSNVRWRRTQPMFLG